ncbi:hypothetical protein G7Z17_g10557 [Cylindrodendrum hubeiense]|uniref:Uncharacterized protein n=1 Tax=Cylindrodendrum hubeiense TaxID=595255 RepID=A0A9P5H1X8_9HYPO|nr:hypothetical protein G7Z17_g10557 [Cylindrodendrum hubeiense]
MSRSRKGSQRALELEDAAAPERAVEAEVEGALECWGRERAAVAIAAAQLQRPASVKQPVATNDAASAQCGVTTRGVEALFANADPRCPGSVFRSSHSQVVQIPRQDWRRSSSKYPGAFSQSAVLPASKTQAWGRRRRARRGAEGGTQWEAFRVGPLQTTMEELLLELERVRAAGFPSSAPTQELARLRHHTGVIQASPSLVIPDATDFRCEARREQAGWARREDGMRGAPKGIPAQPRRPDVFWRVSCALVPEMATLSPACLGPNDSVVRPSSAVDPGTTTARPLVPGRSKPGHEVTQGWLLRNLALQPRATGRKRNVGIQHRNRGECQSEIPTAGSHSGSKADQGNQPQTG